MRIEHDFDGTKNLFMMIVSHKKYSGENNLFTLKIQTLSYYTCPETSTETFFNALLQNLMRMEHFEICILKLI